jgi:hypothetical protein
LAADDAADDIKMPQLKIIAIISRRNCLRQALLIGFNYAAARHAASAWLMYISTILIEMPIAAATCG